MAELIDRQVVLAEMRRSGRAAYMIVQDAPTVDAVEVIHCKDCKHMEIEPCGRYCHVWGFFNGASDEGFCNYAERRNNA